MVKKFNLKKFIFAWLYMLPFIILIAILIKYTLKNDIDMNYTTIFEIWGDIMTMSLVDVNCIFYQPINNALINLGLTEQQFYGLDLLLTYDAVILSIDIVFILLQSIYYFLLKLLNRKGL